MSGTNQFLITANNQNGITGGFLAVVGGGRWDGASSSTNQRINMKIGATFSNMSAVFTGGVANGTLTFRPNGSAGNQTVTGNSGRVTDITHTDSSSATNLVDYTFSTGFALIANVSMQMNTTTQYALQGSGPGAGNADFNFPATTQYTTAMGGQGELTPGTVAGIAVQQAIESAGTASQFAINISTATSGTGTVILNKNGSSGNSTCTAGSGITGLVLDATHSDACTAGDLLCVSIVSTNASGGIHTWTFSYVGSTSGMDCTNSAAGTLGIGTIPAYFPFGGSMTATVTQVNSQCYAPYGLTASNLRVSWSTATTSATMAFQIGGVTGNQTVSWSGSGGVVVDSTHTDSVSATNIVGGSITSGSSVNISSVGFAPNDGSISGAHPRSMGGMHG